MKIEIGGMPFPVSRPHSFGLVIDAPTTDFVAGPQSSPQQLASGNDADDYMHQVLLSPENRDAFLQLVEDEGLVVCRNVRTSASTYRRVRGKSSGAKLSQAEYYHHDGCSCPEKPRVVEIRCPYQDVSRQIATAIAPFPDVVRAMLQALPVRLMVDSEFADWRDQFSGSVSDYPPAPQWDRIQGRVTRLVRREMDAESCRTYFREVDRLANAYVLPWQMGESRLMINSRVALEKTMQHRRAYQKPREALEQNGSLVKRWTAEEA